MARLPVGDRMLVKIAAAFLEDAGAPARLFVMDEPTAALNGEESERLFRVIESFARTRLRRSSMFRTGSTRCWRIADRISRAARRRDRARRSPPRTRPRRS